MAQAQRAAPGTESKETTRGDARFTCEVRPAGAFEELIETMFGLAADGKTSKIGMSNPLRLAVIAKHHFDDVRLPVIPHVLQRAALAAGDPLGRVQIARSKRRRERPLSPRKETLCRTANVAGP